MGEAFGSVDCTLLRQVLRLRQTRLPLMLFHVAAWLCAAAMRWRCWFHTCSALHPKSRAPFHSPGTPSSCPAMVVVVQVAVRWEMGLMCE